MSVSASIVLYAVVWFMTLFVVLPLRLKSQSEAGDVVPGTPASAPANPQVKKRMIIVTVVATVIWIPICAIIISGILSIEKLGLPVTYD